MYNFREAPPDNPAARGRNWVAVRYVTALGVAQQRSRTDNAEVLLDAFFVWKTQA